MSSQVTKMSMIYGGNVWCRVAFWLCPVGSGAFNEVMLMTRPLRVWVHWRRVKLTHMELVDLTMDRIRQMLIVLISVPLPVSPPPINCLSLSPPPEQGREFSQPWSSARSRALETITREEVKQQKTKDCVVFYHKFSLILWIKEQCEMASPSPKIFEFPFPKTTQTPKRKDLINN